MLVKSDNKTMYNRKGLTMKSIKYEQLLNLNYDQAINHLMSKYGDATEDYFSEKSYQRFKDGEIKSLTKKKISRTAEGLYCHHIDEDKQIMISNPNAIKKYDIPFAYQRKDRLCYCDLIEHGILHAIIAVEQYKKFNTNDSNQLFGIGGYINFIRPELTKWLINNDIPKASWQLNCYNKIKMNSHDAGNLIDKIDSFLIKNYPITQDEINRATQIYIDYGNSFKS